METLVTRDGTSCDGSPFDDYLQSLQRDETSTVSIRSGRFLSDAESREQYNGGRNGLTCLTDEQHQYFNSRCMPHHGAWQFKVSVRVGRRRSSSEVSGLEACRNQKQQSACLTSCRSFV